MIDPMSKRLIVTCTQKTEAEAVTTLLVKSFYKNDLDANFDLEIVSENTTGLSECYNRFVTQEIADKYNSVLFVHDDVWIDDYMLAAKLNDAHYRLNYDIVGIAGTLNPEIKHPSLWHIMGSRENHRGYAGHLCRSNANYPTQGYGVGMTGFGPTPGRVTIADGLFLSVNIHNAVKAGWRWNETFKFHHYDIASCIDANRKGMKIGVYPINVMHLSPGLESLEDKNWSASNKTFLELYNVANRS